MSSVAEKIAEGALALPPEERAELVERLWVSLDTNALADSESEWVDLAQSRASEIDRGEVECKSAEEVLRRERKRPA